MIEVTYNGRAALENCETLLGMDCIFGKGRMACYDLLDGIMGIAIRLEMSDFLERRRRLRSISASMVALKPAFPGVSMCC